MPSNREIRSYISANVANGLIGVMALYPAAMILVAISRGTTLNVLWLPASICLTLIVLWCALRMGTYISIDLQNETLNGAAFFLPPRTISVSAITHVGVGGAFLSWTVMKVTFRTVGGTKRTVGVGIKQALDKGSFDRILEAIVRINPDLVVPSELRN
jgi:hypothetical protein